MDFTKLYIDSEGIERNILQMVKLEPEWAANRIQEGEKVNERLAECEGFLEAVDPNSKYFF